MGLMAGPFLDCVLLQAKNPVETVQGMASVPGTGPGLPVGFFFFFVLIY